MAASYINKAQRKNNLIRMQRRKSLAQVGRESHAQRGYRPGGAYREIHPAIEEAGGVAIGFTHVYVLAAGVGKHAAQFGKGEAGQQRHAHAHHPHGKKKPRMTGIDGDILGGEKNARAYDPARQQQDGVRKRKSADEFSVTWQYENRA